MDQERELCVIGPDDADRRTLDEALDMRVAHRFEGVDVAMEALDDDALLVVTPAVSDEQLLELARHISDHDRNWILLRVESRGEDGLRFRPISAGFPLEAGRVVDAAVGGEDDRPVFDLLEVLRRVARIRHDINNPLTAGLAETQLLLMDVEEEGEVRESLETVQRQLRRIQELVERLNHLRRPTRTVG